MIIMATTGFYLDCRAAKGGKGAPLKISICHKGKAAYVNTGVYLDPANWDAAQAKVIGRSDRRSLNSFISTKKLMVDNAIYNLSIEGKLRSLDARGLKQMVVEIIDPDNNTRLEAANRERLFATRFERFASMKKPSTRDIYMQTYRRINAYAGSRFNEMTFEEVTKEWLVGFDSFLAQTSPSRNARNVHLRNIRAVFNEAIDDGLTSFYPFRRMKIRPVATAKRSLTVDQLRTLFAFRPEPLAQKYLDYFKLSFYLIGINMIDLCYLKSITDGRVEYHRSKTSRLYSIKVEPEAAEIIARYRGKKYLLDIMDRYTNHKDFTHRLNENLRKMGEFKRVGRGGRKIRNPLFPELSSYWARHTWATIAASLDIPKETIAAALGHGGTTVTDIYIDFDRRKIDEANRRVIDWVLYGRR